MFKLFHLGSLDSYVYVCLKIVLIIFEHFFFQLSLFTLSLLQQVINHILVQHEKQANIKIATFTFKDAGWWHPRNSIETAAQGEEG